MRRLGLDDVVVAARALRAVPPEERRVQVQHWCNEAHCADKYRKRTGRVHPRFGTGSLAARVGSRIGPPTRPGAGTNRAGRVDQDLGLIALVADALVRWRHSQSARGGGEKP